MSRLDLFLKSRKPVDFVERVAVSTDFTDEDGSPLLWELKPVSASADEILRLSCLKGSRAPLSWIQICTGQSWRRQQWCSLI